MNMKFLLGIFSSLAWVIAAVFWLLSLFVPEFAAFNLNWAMVIVAGICGVCMILTGILVEKQAVLKRFNVFMGAALVALAGISVVFALALPTSYIFPIIALIIALGGFVSFLTAGMVKWDKGDNEQEGYQNYYQRKAAEEAAQATEATTPAVEEKTTTEEAGTDAPADTDADADAE